MPLVQTNLYQHDAVRVTEPTAESGTSQPEIEGGGRHQIMPRVRELASICNLVVCVMKEGGASVFREARDLHLKA